jgi:FixJ family two-component response regulator
MRQRAAQMTTREREVFEQVVRGLPNKQIGAVLGIALKTVKVHRGRVMQKMEAGSVADLVRAAEMLADDAP